SPAPTITGISSTSGTAGTIINATVSGSDFLNVSAVMFSGAGISAALSGAVSETSLAIAITIAPDAPVGLRTFSVVTQDNVSSPFSGFTVNPTNLPFILSVTPTSGTQGTSLSITIGGLNLNNASLVTLSGDGVTANITGGVNTSIPASLSI